MAFLDETGLAKVRDWIKGKFVQTVNGQAIDASGNVNISDVPVGTVIAFASATAPSGYLACNGGAVSRTTYADLYKVIGNTFGAGNGSTTFNVPSLDDGRFIEGSSSVGTVHEAGLPNITGRIGRNQTGSTAMFPFWITDVKTGVFASSKNGGPFVDAETNNMIRSVATQYINFNASDSNAIYGNSTTVQPKSLTLRYFIKY